MKTNHKMNALLLTVALGLILNVTQAQPGPPDHGPKPDRGPVRQAELLTNYTGKIVRYVSNDDKIFDGFIIGLSSGETLVKFPGHEGQVIMNAAKIGSNVTVGGVQDKNPRGTNEIRMISLVIGGQTLYDTPPVHGATPPVEESVSINSKIVELKHDLEGRINGVYLADNTIMNFPPHVGVQFASSLKTGENITAQGLLKPKHEGEVYDGKVRIVRAQVVTINGSSYLVR